MVLYRSVPDYCDRRQVEMLLDYTIEFAASVMVSWDKVMAKNKHPLLE